MKKITVKNFIKDFIFKWQQKLLALLDICILHLYSHCDCRFSFLEIRNIIKWVRKLKEVSLDGKLESLFVSSWNLLKGFSFVHRHLFIFCTFWYFQINKVVRELQKGAIYNGNKKTENDLYNINNHLYENGIWILIFSSISRIF